jgi:CBS domain-containing protein
MWTGTVQTVMTREVVSVSPDATFKHVATLLADNDISAVPVVDGVGNLLGVVSEADLLCKQEHADDSAGAGPRRLAGRGVRARWRKAAGRTAAEVMTSPARTIAADASLPEAARRLGQGGVRRLCVVQGGRLVGIVARRDLLRSLRRADRDIQRQVCTEVFDQAVHASPRMVRATVLDGVVTLTGRVEYQGDIATAVRLVRLMPGVVDVCCRLDWAWNGDRVGEPVGDGCVPGVGAVGKSEGGVRDAGRRV